MSAILGVLLWHCDAQGASSAFAEMKLLLYCLQATETDAGQQCAEVTQAQGSLRHLQGWKHKCINLMNSICVCNRKKLGTIVYIVVHLSCLPFF